MKIIIIEDDKAISFALERYLEKLNIETRVFRDLSSTADLDLEAYDLMLLDVNLPDGSGFDYLKWLREESDLPVIMLTVKDDDQYIIQGLAYGADDYITKPFSLPVLKARIDNVLRRKKKGEILSYKDLTLDLKGKMASLGEKNLDLSRQEFDLLEMFLENININLTRDRLINEIWGNDLYEVNDNTLSVTVKRLRGKLGPFGDHIKTVRGLGYLWEDQDE